MLKVLYFFVSALRYLLLNSVFDNGRIGPTDQDKSQKMLK